ERRSPTSRIITPVRAVPRPSGICVRTRKSARKQVFTQISADARGCTQMERNASRAVCYTLDLQAWLAEVEQAEPQAGCFEIVDALGAMRLVRCLDGLQLDQERRLDQQVHEVFAVHCAVIGDRDAALLCDRESRLAKLVCQRILLESVRNLFSQYQ